MKRSVIFGIAAIVFCFLISSTEAAVYKWVDEKGKVWITDYPNPKAQKQDSVQPEPQPVRPQPIIPENISSAKPDNADSAKPRDGMKTKPFSMPQIPSDFRKGMPADQSMFIYSLIAMMSMFMLPVIIALYIYLSVCLYMIAKKTDVSSPWLAWIPVANLWVTVTAAGKDWWWMLLFLVPLVNIGVTIYIWMCITENVGKDKWLGLLMIVPIVQLVWMGILAFSKQETYSSDALEGQA